MDPLLYEAAASGDLVLLKRKYRDLDVTQVTKQQQNSVLHIAVKFKQLEFLREIINISGMSSLLKSNSKCESPLHVAATIGSLEITKLLVDWARFHPFVVVESGDFKLLRMVNLEKDTALYVAIKNGHFAVDDKELLSLVNNTNATPLCLAIEGGFCRIASFIIEKFPESLNGNVNIKTMLHSAVIQSRHDIIELLLKKTPNLRYETDQIGWTALHYAALYGDLKSIQLLLEGNVSNAYIVDQDEMSALHVAASRGDMNALKLLVQCCPDLHEVTDKNGRTLLHVAVLSGQEKMVKHILQMSRLFGIVNEKDNEGNTALHLAVIYNKDNIITHLARNKDMERAIVNNNLFTAYDIFFLQPRMLSILVAKTGYLLAGTNRLTALQKWVNTKLKREMIGKTEENDTNTSRKEDEVNIITTTANEASDETEQRSRLEVHLLIATLIATVTFQAAFTVPGGYKEDGPYQGTAQFIQKAAFKAFVVFNTIAFIFSTATVYMQFATSKLSCQMQSRYACLARVKIFIAIFGMLLAFASGMYVVLANSIDLSLIGYIMVACFVVIYYTCWLVDPSGKHIAGIQQLRKYFRRWPFRYGII